MTRRKIKKLSLVFFTFLFFTYLFFVYDANFFGPDKPIYLAYTASAVEEGDLNAVNHLDNSYPYRLSSGKIGISSTYNLPDFHDHGGIVLWAPFYAYSKFFYRAAENLGLASLTADGSQRFTRCAMAFSTVLFGFLTMFFSYKLCRVFFNRRLAVCSTLALFLGTPFFYFMIQETGNANIIACLFSVISIWFAANAVNMGKKHWFLYGLFFSLCIIVKIDLIFQLFFVFMLFIWLLRLKKSSWLCGGYFLLGLILMFSLKIFNGYIKYGIIRLGIFGTLNPKGDYLFEQLFSSYRGFFYTSPLFYLCLLGLALAAVSVGKSLNNPDKEPDRRITDDTFLLILSAYVLIKIFFLGFRYAWGGGTCGARPLLTEFPVFVLLCARGLSLRPKPLLALLAAFIVLSVLWNILVVAEFKTQLDMRYVAGMPDLAARIKAVKGVPEGILLSVKDLGLKLRSVLPLFILSSAAAGWLMLKWRRPPASFWQVKNKNPRAFHKAIFLLTAYLCLAYVFFTLSNVYNNRRKAQRLKAEGFFANTVILSPEEFEAEENIGSMNEMIQYYESKNDLQRAEKIRRLKKELYGNR